VADPNNETLSALHNECFYGWAVYDGSGQRTFVAPSNYADRISLTGRCGWQMLACSWDLTTGHLRVFVNDSYDSGWVECGSPAAGPLRMYLGPQAAGARALPVYLQYLAAWSGKLTAVQIANLYAEGPRYVPVAEDGAGTFTFLATFDGGYGADVAEGDGELYTTACPAPDRYCRLPDGQFEYARQTYFLGRPRHDGQEFDRCPVGAIFHPGHQPESYSIENDATEGRIVLPADAGQQDVNRGPLVPGGRLSSDGKLLTLTPVRTLQPPCTYRVRLRINSDGAPRSQRVRLGSVDYVHYPVASANVFDPNGYGSFQAFTVQSDAGNGKAAFKTNLDETDAVCWQGAYCQFLRGANAGRALKVTSYDPATKRLTLEAEMPNVPAAGDLGVVAQWARLQGVDADGSLGDWQNLEVVLDETHGSSQAYFPELDWLYVEDNWYDANYPSRYHPNYLRFDRGRTVVMEGVGYGRLGTTEGSALYGRPKGSGSAGSFQASLRLQKVEMSGTWQYQLLRADGEQGPSLADDFLVWIAPAGEQGLTTPRRSVKVWRQRGVVLDTQKPTKYATPSAVQGDLKTAPWRAKSCGTPWPVEERGDEVLAVVVGEDTGGTRRIGYILGTWNQSTGRIDWADETPPEGKSNPFFEGGPMSVDRAPDTPTVYTLTATVLPLPDGKWMMQFPAKMGDPDHSQSGLLLGAEDRWTFDRQRHWWRDNPLMGVNGGVDVPKLTGGGTGTWANRDASYGVLYDPHTEYPARRYLAYARGKSLVFGYTKEPHDIRPLIGLRSSDGRVWTALGEGRQITPLCSPEHSVGGTFIYDDGAVGLGTSDGSVRISEDGAHWQQAFPDGSFMDGNPVPGEGTERLILTTFRLGDRRIYYYTCDLGLNIATIRYNGEALYGLAEGGTEGMVETVAILRPGESWDRDLVINADPGEGSIRVELVDVDTERVIAGFGEDDCASVPDDCDHAVRWGALPLSEITAECVRVRFWLRRPQAVLASPRLYAWRLERRDPPRPSASDQAVNGQATPAGVTDPTPTFSWTYTDPRSLPQSAYRVLVASSQQSLDAGVGDLWDSGVVESEAAQAPYGGQPLSSYRVYFWKVLVRNSEGVWSEG